MTINKLDKELFKEILRESGITQYELAKKVGINEKTFSLYLKNEGLTDAQKESVAKELHTSVDKLWPDIKKPGIAPGEIDYKSELIEALKKQNLLLEERVSRAESSLTEVSKAILENRALLEVIFLALMKHRQEMEHHPEMIRDEMRRLLSGILQKNKIKDIDSILNGNENSHA